MACGLSQQELRDFGIALVDGRCQAQQADGSLCGDLVTAHCASNKKLNALIMGPAEGGSGTLFKQIAVAFGNGISESQRVMFLPVMINGVISSLRALMHEVDTNHARVKSPESWDFVMGDVNTINPSNLHHFLGVWDEPGIQAAHSEMLHANLEYFMKRLPALTAQGFVPSTEDYMWMHYPTRGLIFHRQIALPEGVQCKVTFLGSAENYFAYDIDVVMFVANLMAIKSPTDLANDLAFFERVCNARTMTKANIYLLLNKNDLFQSMKSENSEAENEKKQIHDFYSEQDHRAWDGTLLPTKFFPQAIPGSVLYLISAYVGRFLPIFYTTLTDSVQAKSVLSKCLQL